jgi:hypothetical protein
VIFASDAVGTDVRSLKELSCPDPLSLGVAAEKIGRESVVYCAGIFLEADATPAPASVGCTQSLEPGPIRSALSRLQSNGSNSAVDGT